MLDIDISDDKISKIKSRVLWVCKAVASEPDKLQFETTVIMNKLIIYVKPSAPDLGIMIGKQGSMADAFRVLARSIGSQEGVQVEFNIIKERQEY